MSVPVSAEIRERVLQELIEPSYFQDVEEMVRGRRYWRIAGQKFETLSKIFVAFGGILSFSGGYFHNTILSFLAGSFATITLACLQMSSHSFQQSMRQTKKLNILLEKLRIQSVPVLNSTNSNDPPTPVGSREDVSVPRVYPIYPQPLVLRPATAQPPARELSWWAHVLDFFGMDST
jgi:hypothetical protein